MHPRDTFSISDRGGGRREGGDRGCLRLTRKGKGRRRGSFSTQSHPCISRSYLGGGREGYGLGVGRRRRRSFLYTTAARAET